MPYLPANLPELEAVLNEMAQEFAQLYLSNLEAHNRPASGDLERAVATTRVVVDGNIYEVSVQLPAYWKYVDTGTKGRYTGNPNRKFPPFQAILRWVNIKPNLPRPAGLTPEQFAGKIGGKIMYYGTKGTHDLADARTAVIEKYKERIATALGHDALYYIVKASADS